MVPVSLSCSKCVFFRSFTSNIKYVPFRPARDLEVHGGEKRALWQFDGGDDYCDDSSLPV